MSLKAKPGRRAFVKWGLASAGVPLVADALGGLAVAKAEPPDAPPDKAGDSGERGGSTVSLASGIQMYYKEDWLGAPWLTGEPALLLHGNLETHEIWFGWVPRMAQQFRISSEPRREAQSPCSLPQAIRSARARWW